MRKVSASLCAILAFSILSCSSLQKQLPANVQGTGILAVGVNFKVRSALGSLSNAEVRYVRAARLSGGEVKMESVIGTDIIKDGVAYFVGVEPGEYVFTDLVFMKNLGAVNVMKHQSSFEGNIVKLVVASVSAEDSIKTAVKVEAGSLSYMNRLQVLSEGKIGDLVPFLDEEKTRIKQVRIDKGYAVRLYPVDETAEAKIKEIIKNEADAASFRTKANRVLGGTEWQTVLEPKAPVLEVAEPVSDAAVPAAEMKDSGSDAKVPVSETMTPGSGAKTPAADAKLPASTDAAQEPDSKK